MSNKFKCVVVDDEPIAREISTISVMSFGESPFCLVVPLKVREQSKVLFVTEHIVLGVVGIRGECHCIFAAGSLYQWIEPGLMKPA